MFRPISVAICVAAVSSPVSAQLTLDSLYARLGQSARVSAARQSARAAESRLASARRRASFADEADAR